MRNAELYKLGAEDAAGLIRDGRVSSEQLVSDCLEEIGRTDPTIKAWAHLDPQAALDQAREADRIRKAGRATGMLHGVPVGLKDIVDTKNLPTECGSPAMNGRQPDKDAAVVERLIDAGAVIMGKTKTAELAYLSPTDTTNPHDASRTPGGSSSGSAAAVAANHVPLAIGTQTNGSVVRPASFCGVFGFKPTRGVISRNGLLKTSESLDQVGVFARSLNDAALLSDAIKGYDQDDAASFARPRPAFLEGAKSDILVEPDIAWFEMPYHDRLSSAAKEGLEAVIEALGPRVERFEPAPQLAGLVEVQATIHIYEMCQHLGEFFDGNWEMLSDLLKPVIEKGRKISEAQYEDALAVKASAQAFFTDFSLDFDAILAPSATGEAPDIGLGTGDPIFCTIWTLAGLPSLTMPLLVGENDLPIGVQLIGSKELDDRLLRTANWVLNNLQAEA